MVRGGPVFSTYHASMKTCGKCNNKEMELLEAGSYTEQDVYRCQMCGTVYKRDSLQQFTVGGLKLWWRFAKFMYKLTK